MKRKIIELGNNCMVMSLPIKWVREQGLKKGAELSIEQQDSSLVVSVGEKQKKPCEIEITLRNPKESVIRTYVVNAYRAGYDKIMCHYSGPKAKLLNVVGSQLLGFEIFDQSKDIHIIESVSEPSLESHDKIVNKLFFIILEILKGISSAEVGQHSLRVQRYDNFLKRCISKGVFSLKSKTFMWQFLSGLTEISRQAAHLNEYLRQGKQLSSQQQQAVRRIAEMVEVLQKSYIGHDATLLAGLHKTGHDIVFEKRLNLLRGGDPVIGHYIISLARTTYILSSPLAGSLQMERLF